MFRHRPLVPALILVTAATLFAGCSKEPEAKAPRKPVAEIEGVAGIEARVILDGLRNPSCVIFSPDGELTVCDTGHGRVVLVKDGEARDYVTGFVTEFWKVDPDSGTKRFQVGPLSAVWYDRQLIVSDGGQSDGAEALVRFTGPGDAASGERTAPVKSLETDPAMVGEGNLTGMSLDRTTGELYICGHGDDAKTWLLRFDHDENVLGKWASADDNGITVNSPMQTLIESKEHILVLYSGVGGVEDGLLVRWDRKTAKPVRQWTLPGLIDPMGMAFIPGTKDLAVVDNNWALTEVKKGKLARVSLGEGDAAKVEILATGLMGPVSCVFGPDKRLYIAQLGSAIDAENGQVIAVQGF